MDILDYYFDHFQTSAVRLETLPLYAISETNEYAEYEAYKAGKEIEGFANQGWIDCLEDWKGEGKTISRVRICPEPVTDYFKYEFSWCYPRNMTSGERISFVSHTDAAKVDDSNMLADYWLFDNAHLVQLLYDDQGEYVTCKEITDVDNASKIKELIRNLMSISKSYAEIIIK